MYYRPLTKEIIHNFCQMAGWDENNLTENELHIIEWDLNLPRNEQEWKELNEQAWQGYKGE